MNISLFNYRIPCLTVVLFFTWTAFHFLISLFGTEVLIYGLTPTTLTIATLYWHDKHPWKSPIGKLLVSVPNLNGTYEGEIKYSHGGVKSHKNVTLKVEQTASTIRVTGNFFKAGENDTASESREAFFATNNKRKLIVYYESKGDQISGGNLTPHDGLAVLNVDEESGKTTLTGAYFTNREPQTKGKIEVTRKERN